VKSALPVELETDVPILVSGNPPLLVIVTVSGGDVCPNTVDAKLKLVVDNVSVGARRPVPLNCALCVPTLSVTVMLPVAAPAAFGAKSTVTAHAVDAASVLPQVLVTFANGALTVIDEIETGLPPTF
jgi:hypothetical protein